MPKDEKVKDKEQVREKTSAEKIKEDKINFEKSLKKENSSQLSPPIPPDDAVNPVRVRTYFYVTGRVKVTPDSQNVVIVYR